jgi:RNA polymerase sigma-70 factor (ECF subfamily)
MGSVRHSASQDYPDKSKVPGSPDDAENEAFKRLIPELRRYARALMPRRSDAEDLTQDCMLRVWAHIDGIEDMRAYLFQTLRSAYADRMNRLSRDVVALALDDAKVQIVDPRSLHLRLEMRDVARQIAKLPYKQRQVLLLIAGGATYDEAALRLHVPVGTIMSRLSRARKALRDSFAAIGETLD